MHRDALLVALFRDVEHGLLAEHEGRRTTEHMGTDHRRAGVQRPGPADDGGRVLCGIRHGHHLRIKPRKPQSPCGWNPPEGCGR